MAKSAEVKLAVFGRAGVGKSGKAQFVCVYVFVYSFKKREEGLMIYLSSLVLRLILN